MEELVFGEDEGFEVLVDVKGGVGEIFLSISDDLDSAYEPVGDESRERIRRFIDRVEEWLPVAERRLEADASSIDLANDEAFTLVRITILSELVDADLVFGLQFWVSGDVEHGRGMKIRESDFEILDYGSAEVAIFPD